MTACRALSIRSPGENESLVRSKKTQPVRPVMEQSNVNETSVSEIIQYRPTEVIEREATLASDGVTMIFGFLMVSERPIRHDLGSNQMLVSAQDHGHGENQ